VPLVIGGRSGQAFGRRGQQDHERQANGGGPDFREHCCGMEFHRLSRSSGVLLFGLPRFRPAVRVIHEMARSY
jgi:hypothetical protein